MEGSNRKNAVKRISRRDFVKGTAMLSASSMFFESKLLGGEAPIEKSGDVVNIGSRLELMVDEFLIEECSGGARRKMHRPHPKNVAIGHDESWEGNCQYHTIFKDGDIHRMYYRTAGRNAAYAESTDGGMTFQKPGLGIIEVNGSKQNNLVWKGDPIGHNLTPFKDTNPDCKPDHRYKAIGGVDDGVFALVSPDGIHWEKLAEDYMIRDGHFDSQNVAFWDGQRGHYRAYYRDWHRGPRQRLRGIMTTRITRGIKTATSEDFLNWTEGRWLKYPDAFDGDILLENVHLYTNVIKPYYRAPHIFIGFPQRYVEREFGASSQQLPNSESNEQLLRRIERKYALTETVLMTSRDAQCFSHWPEAFIRPGLRKDRWAYNDNAVAWQVIETVADGPGDMLDLSLYVLEGSRDGAEHTQLRRYALRLDGFASINAPLSGGEMVTRPIRFEGNRLVINYSTSAAGRLRVEIQDANGQPIPEFSLSKCDEIYGDQLEHTVSWQDQHNVADIEGSPVRLRFVLEDADLYSFAFQDLGSSN